MIKYKTERGYQKMLREAVANADFTARDFVHLETAIVVARNALLAHKDWTALNDDLKIVEALLAQYE